MNKITVTSFGVLLGLTQYYLITAAYTLKQLQNKQCEQELDRELNRQAQLRALEICQERMMQGKYVDGVQAMTEDIDREIEIQKKNIRK